MNFAVVAAYRFEASGDGQVPYRAAETFEQTDLLRVAAITDRERLTVSVERARKIRQRHEPVQRQIAMEHHLAVAVEKTAPCRIAGERFRESLEIRLAANAVVHLVSMVDLPDQPLGIIRT